MCQEHLCHHLPFRLFSTEGKKESIWRRGRRMCGWSLIVRLWAATLSNYNTSNNSAFTHSQLQISPLGCRLPVALLWAGRGCMCVCVCVCACVCVCVCVCKPIRVGRWEGTFPGWETAVLSQITRQTGKPRVVSWCDVDSNCLWCALVEQGHGGSAFKWWLWNRNWGCPFSEGGGKKYRRPFLLGHYDSVLVNHPISLNGFYISSESMADSMSSWREPTLQREKHTCDMYGFWWSRDCFHWCLLLRPWCPPLSPCFWIRPTNISSKFNLSSRSKMCTRPI